MRAFYRGSTNFGKYDAGPSLEHGFYAGFPLLEAYVIGIFHQSPLHISPVPVIGAFFYA